MTTTCPRCAAPVIEVDVKCGDCGAPLGTTGAHRLIGQVMLGQYRVVEMLGQGGMSTVYRAVHGLTEQEVALKILPPDLAALGQVKSRFLEEARALAQLDHPNIVHLYNYGSEGGSVVLAMQFIAGQTWERMILAAQRQPWPEAARVAIDVLRALEYAHARGIVHRDMKPSNVLVREHDGAATVMDFGIAKMTTSTRLTAAGQTMGTVRYMSPEQVRGQDVDLRTDLYSLGASIYEAIHGDTPFDGSTHFEIMTKHLTEPPRSLRARGHELPDALDAVVLRTLAKRPADRFATARELRKELEAILRESGPAELAETQRVSRKGLAAALAAPRRPAAAPAAAPAAPTTELLAGGLVAATDGATLATDVTSASATPALPASASASASATASSSSPGAAVPAAGPSVSAAGPSASAARPVVSETTLAPASGPIVAGGGRPWLWFGLAAAVAVAGAAVAYLAVRGRGEPASPFAGTPEPAPPAVVSWGAVGDFPDLPLRVRVARGVGLAPESVAGAYRRARAALPGVLAARNVSAPQFPDPITIGVVPAAVFCDRRLYDSGMPEPCAQTLHYYRIRDPLLLVADRPELLGRIVAQAVAEVSCTYNDVTPCFDRALIEASEGL